MGHDLLPVVMQGNDYSLLVKNGVSPAVWGLTVIALELPAWKVRRLAYENGEWLCSLSRQPHVPIALDDTADAAHEALPLAILLAFVEAYRKSNLHFKTAPTAPKSGRAPGLVLCCDNFASVR